ATFASSFRNRRTAPNTADSRERAAGTERRTAVRYGNRSRNADHGEQRAGGQTRPIRHRRRAQAPRPAARATGRVCAQHRHTDGHRLSYASISIPGSYARQEVILPRKTVLELGKLLEESESAVTIDVLANQVRFRFSNVELVSKVVDGKFPDYNRVIPSGHAKQLDLSRTELLQALQRAAILSNEKFRGVRLVLGSDQLKIICTNSEQEEAEEELEVGYKGEALDIGFNITYLLDVLHNLAADQVVLALGDANSSALITMRERNDYKYVVMPMRI